MQQITCLVYIIKIILLVLSIPLIVNGQLPCPSYDEAMRDGEQAIKQENYDKAIEAYLTAQIAARECNSITSEPGDKLQEVFYKLSQQKEKLAKLLSESKRLQQKKIEQNKALEVALERSKKLQQELTKSLFKSKKFQWETVQQKKELELEQQKAELLKKTIRGNSNNIYQDIRNKGIQLFSKTEYEYALIYFANAQFLNTNKQDSIEISQWLRWNTEAIIAEKELNNENISTVDSLYDGLIFSNYFDSTSFKTRLERIKHSVQTYKDKTQNKVIKDIDTLDLSELNLKYLTQDIFNSPRLSYLNLNENQLDSIPSGIIQLKNLKKLDLSENKLKNISIKFYKFKNLKILNLESNQLNTISDSINNITSLEELNLEDNKLDTMPKGINDLSNLQDLNLAYNKLRYLPNNFKSNQLIELDLRSNHITKLPSSIGELNKLEQLNLDQNKLTELPNSIRKLKKLKYLNLNSNQLKELPISISQLDSLEELILSNNSLSEIPKEIKKLKHLKRLDLRNNKIPKSERLRIKYLYLPKCKVIDYGNK